MRQNLDKFGAYRLISIQLLAVTIISIGWSFVGWHEMGSALMGGMACVFPNICIASHFFSYSHKEPGQIIKAFYWTQILKLAMSVALLLLILIKLKANIWPVFLGFLAAHLSLWLMPLFVTTEARVKN